MTEMIALDFEDRPRFSLPPIPVTQHADLCCQALMFSW